MKKVFGIFLALAVLTAAPMIFASEDCDKKTDDITIGSNTTGGTTDTDTNSETGIR